MTRGNLLIVIILVLALVGMFFWTLDLHNRQAALSSGGGGAEGGVDARTLARLGDLENQVGSLGNEVRLQSSEVGQLKTRVLRIEEGGGPAALAPEAPVAGTPVASSGAAAPRETELRAAIEEVIQKRDEEERRERIGRMAEGMSRWLLSEVDATDEQKSQFVTILIGFLNSREDLRQKYSGDNEDKQAQEADIAFITQQRNDQLLQVFGATNFSKIEERLNRSQRGMGGRGRGGRGGSPRGR